MAIIPRSDRTKISPGGAAFPSGSLIRIGTAGAKGRGVAGLGRTIDQIGIISQRINDNAQIEKAAIDQQTDVNNIIATNLKDIRDPTLFRDQTLKQIDKSGTVSLKGVNFRNKQKFRTITKRIGLAGKNQVLSQYNKKVVDLSNAQYTVSSGELLNGFLDGNITKEQAVGTSRILIKDRFDNGVWDAERTIKEESDFNGNIEKLDFIRTYEGDPQLAVDNINNSKFLTTEQKTDFLFKMASKIDKAEKKNAVALESKAKIDVSKYDRLSLEGKLVPGFVSEDGLSIESFNADVDNGTIGGTDFRRILKQQRDVFDAGGIGDERVMNQLLATIDDDFSITDTSIDNNKDFNNPQRIKLKNAIETRTNRAIQNPIAASYRTQINKSHKADGIFASSLLTKEISDHLKNEQEIYREFLLQGDDPKTAFSKAENIVGPKPGDSTVSDSELGKLEMELQNFDRQAQEENKANKGNINESRLRDLRFRRQNLVGNIDEMKTQLRIKKFIEELSKNASTGK